MNTLKFSVAEHFENAQTIFEEIAKTCDNTTFRVESQAIPWQIMWSFLQRKLIDADRLDVSEVGSTWIGGFSNIDALAEIDPVDVMDIGGPEHFMPSVWKSASLMNDTRVLSIPWMVDTRVVFYWKDILDQAGVDEKDAFCTPAQMEETLAKLQAASLPTLAVPTFAVTNTVHQIASWLWSTGYDFLTPDATATAFCNEQAVEGIISYFALSRYLTRKYDSLDVMLEAFETKKAAVMISGPWFLRHARLRGAGEKYLKHLGAALPPGPAFVGGSNLVIWKQPDSEPSSDAMDWVRHLTSSEIQRRVCASTGLLPAVRDVLTNPAEEDDPFQPVFAEALTTGRPMPQVAFWGAIEAELVHIFGKIWSDLKEDPRYTARSVVLSHLEPMAKLYDDKLYRHSFTPHPPA